MDLSESSLLHIRFKKSLKSLNGKPDYDEIKTCLKLLRKSGKEGANISGYIASLSPSDFDLVEFILIEFDSINLINSKLLNMIEKNVEWDWEGRQDELEKRWQLIINVMINCAGGPDSLSGELQSKASKAPYYIDIDFATRSTLNPELSQLSSIASNLVSSDRVLSSELNLLKQEVSNGLL